MAKKAIVEEWQAEDAARLKAIWNSAKRCSQAQFGADHDIGNQGAVWQYLNGRIPLNVDAAAKFAVGLGVQVQAFSPTLAKQIAKMAGSAPAASVKPQLLQDFEALPPGLQEYIARKTADLRRYVDSLPALLRDNMGPPKDEQRYHQWERELEAEVTKAPPINRSTT